MEKLTAIVINYNIYWLLISALFTGIFAPPLYWIAYELWKKRKNTEDENEYFHKFAETEMNDGDILDN
jgi:hypothetical protein